MAKILVTGANGGIGSRLVKRLVARKVPVRAFVREEKAGRLPAEVEAFTGDLSDRVRVRAALEGISGVYLLTAGANLSQLEANVIDAARELKVQHIVKHSTQGAPYESTIFGRWHRAGEKRIEEAGIPFTFLRPSSFA